MSFISYLKNIYLPSVPKQLGFSGEDILVIVNIDDVGMHRDVTDASFKAFEFGMVKSGSIMTPCPDFEYSIEHWKKVPNTGLGVHLTLTCEWQEKYPWSPVLSDREVPSLYNSNGLMWATNEEFFAHAKMNDIKKELEAQINKILDTGLKPSHLDHHMNVYRHPAFLSIILELSHKYSLFAHIPVRKRYKLPFTKNNLWTLRKKGFIFSDSLMGAYSTEGERLSLKSWEAQYHDYLRSLKPGLHVIKVHIASKTEDFVSISSQHDSSIRQMDYEIWTSESTKNVADELGITFIDYRQLQNLQNRMINH